MTVKTGTRIKLFFLNYRRIFVIIFHLFLITFSYLSAFYLRFDFSIPRHFFNIYALTLPLVLIVKFFIFYYFGVFGGLWRYVCMSDLWQILKANALSTFVFICFEILFYGFYDFPSAVFAIDFIVCSTLVAGIRFFVRFFRERCKVDFGLNQKKILIIGAGEAGILTLKEYQNNPAMGAVVGFIDDDPSKHHATIYGKRILGRREQISDIVERFCIEEIILAIPSARGELIRDIVSKCQIPGVKLRIVPGLHRILDGELEVKARDVKPEDLLGRETVKVDDKEISSYVENKRILITGAAGSIGSALCRQLIRYNPQELILFDYNENNIYFFEVELKTKHPNIRFKTVIGDIKDVGLLKHVFSRYSPQVVFHAAAHKHVPLMQDNPVAAVKNNIIGSRNLIYAAQHYRVERFVLISTDKAVEPTSIMGATKRIAEMILQTKAQHSTTKFMAVRFGNVIGSDGSVIPLFKKQIEEGGPITVTHPEVKRYFMSAQEAATLVLQAGALGGKGEIFMLDMGEQIKIVELARNLIILSGLKPDRDIAIKFTGLRPGEKLAEEMFHEVEKSEATKFNKIHILQPKDFDRRKLRCHLKELEKMAKLMEEKKIVKKIQELVPSLR